MIPEYNEALHQYYEKWYRDSNDSVQYCLKREMIKNAESYKKKANKYFELINENREKFGID